MNHLGIPIAVLLVVCACAAVAAPSTSTAESYARRPKDAAVDSPPAADAPTSGAAGWASCYTSGSPDAACNLSSQFCCFNELDSPNNGWCTNWGSQCLRSWNFCDGNEDCPTGTLCTGHIQPATFYEGNIFAIECRASLGAGDRQLCHPGDGTCPAGSACVLGESSAVGWYGLSPKIYVCDP